LDFVAENGNWPKTVPREQWSAISRDLYQRGRSDLSLDDKAFGEVETVSYGYFFKAIGRAGFLEVC
jgi:hypothetical protein